ncbi:MAG: MOSC domain-containing protein [Xanthomonadales bacterium]|nr:MOSC domain-containing protein [Xanthomonadales bacterium]
MATSWPGSQHAPATVSASSRNAVRRASVARPGRIPGYTGRVQLEAIYRYPLKSAAAQPLAQATVEPRGLKGDRRWLVVDADGRFLTGRQLPALVRIRAVAMPDGLVLQSPGSPTLALPKPNAQQRRRRVRIWKDDVDALTCGADADAWLSRVLGRPVSLVYMDAGARRPVDPVHARPGDEVSFADGYPLLLLSAAALATLGERVGRPMAALRFRPNLVVGGCPAHAEDGWRRLRIGEVEFEAAKPCTRCVFTLVDPDTGVPDPQGEPLASLKAYRRGDSGVTFGVNLIPRGEGRLRTGDAVVVLD